MLLVFFSINGNRFQNVVGSKAWPRHTAHVADGFSSHVCCCLSVTGPDNKLAGINTMDKATRCPEDTTGGREIGQSDRPPRSREEMRELVNTPLPSTWRRSSLPTEETTLVEELRLRTAGDAPTNRTVQPGLGCWGGPAAPPVVKSRRESRRSSLNIGPLASNNAFIDVRKNPVWGDHVAYKRLCSSVFLASRFFLTCI